MANLYKELGELQRLFRDQKKHLDRLEQQKRDLGQKRQDMGAKEHQRFARERADLQDQKEEVLKFYRIAKDNSPKDLREYSATPQRPDFAVLNRLVLQIDDANRNDPTAGKMIDLASGYCAWLNEEIRKIDSKEKTGLGHVDRDVDQMALELERNMQKIRSQTEAALKQDSVRNLVKLLNMIHKEYTYSQESLDIQNQSNKGTKKIMVLGYLYLPVSVPMEQKALVKRILGDHYSEKMNLLRCPYVYSTAASKEIYVEYTPVNREKVMGGVGAVILNYLRHFKLGEYRITILDEKHYEPYVLGALSFLTEMRKGIVDFTAKLGDDLKRGTKEMALYYRRLEGRLGSKSVYEYNASCSQEDRIPYRLLIVSSTKNEWATSTEAPELSYVIDNAQRFGVTVLRLELNERQASLSSEKTGARDTRSHVSCRILSKDSGEQCMMDAEGWKHFEWQRIPERLPSSFRQAMEDCFKTTEKGTKFFDRYKPALPTRSRGKRKPIQVPFAVDEDDKVVQCSFENELFAAYMMGASRSGKSTLLHTMISSLIMNYHPDELELWLLDFKMLEFKKYVNNRPPHVKYILLEKSEDLVFDIIDQMDHELRRREYIFSQKGWSKLSEVPGNVYMPAIFIIIDEFAQMSQIIRDTKGAGHSADYTLKLVNLLQKGAAMGFKFIFASQTYTDGVEGLKEEARKQIQQRIALKNTYAEIKDTLSLASDMVNDTIKHHMNTLPPYESLFKYRTEHNEVRVAHLRNMYTEGDEVDRLVAYINKNMKPATAPGQMEDQVYRNKKAVVIDGGHPQTFRSQIPQYKAYETKAVLEELDENDVLIYPGVPTSFRLARPFTIGDSVGENILVAGGDRDSLTSVMLSVFASYARSGKPIEIWANNKNAIYKRYGQSALKKYNCEANLANICGKITELKDELLNQNSQERLIVVLGYERMANDMEILGADSDGPKPAKPKVEAPEDMAEVLKKIGACADPAEKKRIMDDYNARVAAYNSQKNQPQSPANVIYDARKDFDWVLKRASNYGVHFLMVFEHARDFADLKLEAKVFRHKIVFPMSKDDSYSLLGSNKANDVPNECCAYSDGKIFYSMKPHIYSGIPLNGWQVDEHGNVVQRG